MRLLIRVLAVFAGKLFAPRISIRIVARSAALFLSVEFAADSISLCVKILGTESSSLRRNLARADLPFIKARLQSEIFVEIQSAIVIVSEENGAIDTRR
jgi:hypothetical protein